jgi:hypothetical protein
MLLLLPPLLLQQGSLRAEHQRPAGLLPYLHGPTCTEAAHTSESCFVGLHTASSSQLRWLEQKAPSNCSSQHGALSVLLLLLRPHPLLLA